MTTTLYCTWFQHYYVPLMLFHHNFLLEKNPFPFTQSTLNQGPLSYFPKDFFTHSKGALIAPDIFKNPLCYKLTKQCVRKNITPSSIFPVYSWQNTISVSISGGGSGGTFDVFLWQPKGERK